MISRIISGILIIIIGFWLIIYLGLMQESGIDYLIIVSGVFLLLIGGFLLVNKKEDEIEKIKDK